MTASSLRAEGRCRLCIVLVVRTSAEWDATMQVATVLFTYDARGRLTREVRTDFDSSREYDFTYEYDQGGNRTLKISPLTDFGGLRHEVRYDYDVNRPDPDLEGYITRNNRLMKVETYDIFEDGMSESFTAPETFGLPGGGTQQAQAPPPPTGEIEILVSTSWYYYSEAGNVERVVTNVAGTQAYSATRLGYAQNGQAVTFAVGETWNWTGGAPDPTGYDVTYAREFRYDGARARYLVRELFAPHFANNQYTVLGNTWTDYDGDTAYGDYEIIPEGFNEQGDPVPTHGESIRSYQPGIGLVDPVNTPPGTSTSYYMADHVGTTRGMTDPNGAETESAAFTAFGERVGGNARRFGFVGAWGYQTATSDDAYAGFPFQHVGARYYDPVSGRFLQRDPIGIGGGPNVYVYAGNAPTIAVDPDGKYWWWVGRAAVWVARKTAVPAAKWAGRKAASGALWCARWANRGKLRIGPSYDKKERQYYFSIRWKKKHLDLFKIGGPYSKPGG